MLKSVVSNSHYASSDHNANMTGGANDVFDFRADGKVYFSLSGTKDTSTYTVPGDTKIIIDLANNYEIKTLTSNSFVIYSKDMYSGTYYDEATISCKNNHFN